MKPDQQDGRPAPFTSPECDLRDFAFMPLDVARLRDSELASSETPESCWAAVLLWCASWHQLPAGSIPNEDMWIAKAAGYALRGKIDKSWKTVRAGALRGWVECSDGRLYHPVVCEKARESWKAKLRQRWNTECGRIKKHNERHAGANVPKPSFEEWMSQGCPQGQPLFVPSDTGDSPPVHPPNVPGETPSKGQGEGQGQGELTTSVPDGTGGPPPALTPEQMTKMEIWHAGKAMLEAQGMAKAVCGSFIGKLCKDYGDQIVLEAVRAAAVKQPADAAEYLKATCQGIAGQRPRPNRQEALEHSNRSAAEQAAAEITGGTS
ncbi:DUF1376 domain-containing protein [Cupriavidus metallidurans]